MTLRSTWPPSMLPPHFFWLLGLGGRTPAAVPAAASTGMLSPALPLGLGHAPPFWLAGHLGSKPWLDLALGLGVTWRGVSDLAALSGAGGGREGRCVFEAEGRGVQFRRNRGLQHCCRPRVVLAGNLEVPRLSGGEATKANATKKRGRSSVCRFPTDRELGAACRGPWRATASAPARTGGPRHLLAVPRRNHFSSAR